MRADVYLAQYGHAKSRQSAKLLIESGKVKIDGVAVSKPSHDVDEEAQHTVEVTDAPRFVSRGGEKLDFALECFGIDVNGSKAVDVGASTGGFTDCLLQRGASLVYAVDSGHGQLDLSLQKDKKVVSYEKYNARDMKRGDFPFPFDIAVLDVSFISQTYIHQGICDVLDDGGRFVSLVKPQFECGRSALNSKGIVRSAKEHKRALVRVIESARACGLTCIDVVRSPIEGGDGNVEFLAHFVKCGDAYVSVSENKIDIITKNK